MRIIKKLFSFLFFLVLIFVIYFGYKGYELYKNAVSAVSIDDKISMIRSRDNFTNLDDVSKTFINAVIACEDHRFYIHKGIDLISTTKAFFINLRSKDLVTGGSSITQQLAKNMYFSQKKEFSRKFAEVFVVSQLEDKLNKDEILELYINTIYYGNGYYGIGNASKGYFGKLPSELTDWEDTILAGLPNAPSAYSLTEHSDLALKRQQQVLRAMLKYDYISRDEMEKIEGF